jgi:hypothetical protein
MENKLEIINNPTPPMLLSQAIEKGLQIDQLERFINLQVEWEKREAEKAFRRAFASFQAEKPDLKKLDIAKIRTDKGEFSYNYNAISSIQKSVDPILSKNGLSYRWEQEQKEKKIRITCIVSHCDGHIEKTWIEAEADSTGAKNSIQAIGSTITYLKRYTLEGALGLASGKDDDGKQSKSESDYTKGLIAAVKELDKVKDFSELEKIWNKYPDYHKHETFKIKVKNLKKKFTDTVKADLP